MQEQCTLGAPQGCRGLALPLTPQEPLTQAATHSRPVNREPVQSPTLGGLWTLNPRQGNRSAEAASQRQASCSQTLNRGLSQHLREHGWSRPPGPAHTGEGGGTRARPTCPGAGANQGSRLR